MSKLFAKPVVLQDAPTDGRPTARTTKLAHALRKLKFPGDNEFGTRAFAANSYANVLDMTVASLGLKGDAIKATAAYRAAADFYFRNGGEDRTLDYPRVRV